MPCGSSTPIMPSVSVTRELSSMSAFVARRWRVAALAIGVGAGVLFNPLAPKLSAHTTPPTAPAAVAPFKPTHDYWLYVGAEAADKLYRVRFGAAGTAVKTTIAIGELASEMEGTAISICTAT